MSVTESVGALGAWNVTLADDTPTHILEQLGWFGHIAVVAAPLDPESYGDALLTKARYVGVLRARTQDRRGLAGESMVFWLGDEDGKGDVIETEVSFTSKTLLECLTALMPAAVALGTVYPQPDPAQRYSGKHRYQSRRAAIQTICDAFSVEFRVNGDGTIDVGTQAQLYRATPEALIVRDARGADYDLVAVDGEPDVDESIRDWSSRVVIIGQTEQAGVFAEGALGGTSSEYLDIRGNPVKITRLISESSETEGSIPSRLQLHYNRFHRVTRSVRLSTDEFAAEGSVRCGDMAYVYDPESGIQDPNGRREFRGELIFPDIIRIAGHTWGITVGHTVAFRTTAGKWIDLTPYIVWDDAAGGELVVGDLPASLRRQGDDPLALRVDASRGATQPDTAPPGPPSGLDLLSYTFADSTGENYARLTATWTAPVVNSDGSVPVDIAYYLFHYRTVGRAIWEVVLSDDTSVDVAAAINTAYEAEVAAVDSRGQVGTFSALDTVTTAIDTIAPPTPADPIVSSDRGFVRAEYAGTAAGGGAMPSDTNIVEFHIGTTATFTPTTSTRFAAVSPFARDVERIEGTYGSTYYVRLVAVDRAGNRSTPTAGVGVTLARLADGDVSSLSVAKLIAGTMAADIVIGGRFATALTGARVELNSLGLQKRDSSDNLTVSITGTDNLLAGIYKTALSGRRIEMGVAGDVGTIRFFSGFGFNSSVFKSATFVTSGSSPEEQLALGFDVSGAHGMWNKFASSESGVMSTAGRIVQNVVGGTGATPGFTVYYVDAEDLSGSRLKLFIGDDQMRFSDIDQTNGLRFIGRVVTGTSVQGYIGIFGWEPNRVSSPRLRFATPADTSGFVFGGSLKAGYDSSSGTGTVTNQRMLVRNVADSAFLPIEASNVAVSSDAAFKDDIADVNFSPLARVRKHARVRSYKHWQGRSVGVVESGRRKGEVVEGPPVLRIGLIAQEAIPEMVLDHDTGKSIDLGTGMAIALGAIRELAEHVDARLEDLENRLSA